MAFEIESPLLNTCFFSSEESSSLYYKDDYESYSLHQTYFLFLSRIWYMFLKYIFIVWFVENIK